MNILFDINHPADVHFFRYPIRQLLSSGHRITITARDKDVTLDLLERQGFVYNCLSKARRGLLQLGVELIWRDLQLIRIYRREHIQLSVAFTGACTAQVSRLLGIPSLVFYDNEEAKLQNRITYPFATRIFTPRCYEQELGPKHVRFGGIKELAYLHPNRFRPDPTVLDSLGLSANQRYVVVRTVAWTAAHDIGETGLSPDIIRKLQTIVGNEVRVFLVAEGAVSEDLRPMLLPTPIDKVHDVLAGASLFIGEGATMACECACLGVPSIYVNSLKPSHVTEVERAGLVFPLREEDAILSRAKEILFEEDRRQWKERSAAFAAASGDLASWMVERILEFDPARGGSAPIPRSGS